MFAFYYNFSISVASGIAIVNVSVRNCLSNKFCQLINSSEGMYYNPKCQTYVSLNPWTEFYPYGSISVNLESSFSMVFISDRRKFTKIQPFAKIKLIQLFKVTEHNFDENYKIFLIVTIFGEDAVFASVHVFN